MISSTTAHLNVVAMLPRPVIRVIFALGVAGAQLGPEPVSWFVSSSRRHRVTDRMIIQLLFRQKIILR